VTHHQADSHFVRPQAPRSMRPNPSIEATSHVKR
jgi:hypothetical protein